ncbi:MAG TPA: nucleotidyltransferase family protein [Nocardioides sp.]|nr:nucleotidyltransferase family protein [Nocardioides sp.]
MRRRAARVRAEVDGTQDALREALKRTAVALKKADVPFALTGGYAVWARGGPEPDHDVDFLVAYDDVEQAEQALRADGLEVVHPPEDWLFKAFSDGAMVDLIHRHSGGPAQRSLVEDADVLEVLSVEMPVLSATEVVAQKMLALDEHYCDFGAMLPVVRALREQVDFDRVREETAGNHFSAALLFLLERLGVVDPA